MVPQGAGLVAEHLGAIQAAYLGERPNYPPDEALSRALARALTRVDCAAVSAFIAGELDSQLRETASTGDEVTSGRELGSFLGQQLEDLYQENVALQQRVEHWRHLNTTALALEFTDERLLLEQFDRALQAGDQGAQQRVVSQAVDAIVDKARAEARTRKRRRVALQCAAGFFKARAHELAEGQEFAAAVARLQAADQYDDAVQMLWCETVLVALAREIMRLG